MSEPGPPVPINDLRGNWLASDPEARDAVARVFQSGWYVKGPEHDAFEAELAAYLGLAHAVGLASGTDALVLSLLAVGCAMGSEVVTAANAGGYASIAAAIIGARVVYADVDPATLLMTPETVRAALGTETRAVVVTHLYGNVADAASIAAVCRARGVGVVEDCAQAIGGEFDGRRAGTFGDVAALSFYPTKNLGAAGDGGAIATDDPGIADRSRNTAGVHGMSCRNRTAGTADWTRSRRPSCASGCDAWTHSISDVARSWIGIGRPSVDPGSAS
jgi:dTDP-4-amino-4,6-dideoxygalactose transaminase